MRRTTFRNASGLPNKAQVSTARDMARLAIAIREDFPQFYHYFRTKRFRFKGRTYRNHNNLLGRYTGTDGVKTGYTNASGYNLVASVRRGGKHLIGVVFGGRTGARRDRHMVRLLDRGFAKLTRIAKLPIPPLPMPRPDRRALAMASTTGGGIAALIQATEADDRTATAPTVVRFSATVEKRDKDPDRVANTRRWGIQVGAYSNAQPAHQVIKTAHHHLGPGLNHGLDKVERVHRRHGTIYRARILGLREVEARDACAILITKHLPCVPVPADIELAEAPPTN
jgi:D-alanyl-D-alanine carboxypeptidase